MQPLRSIARSAPGCRTVLALESVDSLSLQGGFVQLSSLPVFMQAVAGHGMATVGVSLQGDLVTLVCACHRRMVLRNSTPTSTQAVARKTATTKTEEAALRACHSRTGLCHGRRVGSMNRRSCVCVGRSKDTAGPETEQAAPV